MSLPDERAAAAARVRDTPPAEERNSQKDTIRPKTGTISFASPQCAGRSGRIGTARAAAAEAGEEFCSFRRTARDPRLPSADRMPFERESGECLIVPASKFGDSDDRRADAPAQSGGHRCRGRNRPGGGGLVRATAVPRSRTGAPGRSEGRWRRRPDRRPGARCRIAAAQRRSAGVQAAAAWSARRPSLDRGPALLGELRAAGGDGRTGGLALDAGSRPLRRSAGVQAAAAWSARPAVPRSRTGAPGRAGHPCAWSLSPQIDPGTIKHSSHAL